MAKPNNTCHSLAKLVLIFYYNTVTLACTYCPGVITQISDNHCLKHHRQAELHITFHSLGIMGIMGQQQPSGTLDLFNFQTLHVN